MQKINVEVTPEWVTEFVRAELIETYKKATVWGHVPGEEGLLDSFIDVIKVYSTPSEIANLNKELGID